MRAPPGTPWVLAPLPSRETRLKKKTRYCSSVQQDRVSFASRWTNTATTSRVDAHVSRSYIKISNGFAGNPVKIGNIRLASPSRATKLETGSSLGKNAAKRLDKS